MTSTPPPPAKQHRYAISDERLAQLYSATAQQDCEMLMFHRDDVLGLLDRLRAAEAASDRLRKALAMPCMHCGMTPRVIIPMKGGGK